jgi:hypothetical protein
MEENKVYRFIRERAKVRKRGFRCGNRRLPELPVYLLAGW